MELQIPHSICAEVPPPDNLWKDQGGSREDIANAVREKRSRNTGSRSVSEPYPYAGKHTAEVQRIRIYGIPEGEKFADDLRQVANMKYRYGNRQFWCRGYYVDTVGRNKKAIEEYIRNQLQEDKEYEQLTMKELFDPFTGEPVTKDKK